MSDVLGLDRHMHEAYHLLLHECACTAARISDRLGISRTQADSTLARLVNAGLVAHASHDPRQLFAVDPRRGLAPLIARRQVELAAHRRALFRCQQAVAELAAAYAERHGSDPPSPAGQTRLVAKLPIGPAPGDDPRGPGTIRADPDDPRGPDARLRTTRTVRARIEGLLETSRSAVMCFLADPASARALDVSSDLVQKAIHRGVSIKAVYAGSILGDEAVRAQARRLVSLGASARAASSLPPAMMVVDRSTALVQSDAGGHDAVVVHNRTLAAALASLFDHVWGDVDAPVRRPPGGADARAASVAAVRTPVAPALGRPSVAPAGPPQDDGPTSQERDLLRLLGQGLTDASAARQLGVSLRTVRRMMAELMARLDARSRFEAGIRAAERGWVGSRQPPPGVRAPGVRTPAVRTSGVRATGVRAMGAVSQARQP